jgi:hypothetical protein
MIALKGSQRAGSPLVWECTDSHAQTETENCLECKEIVLQHCKHLLQLLQQEKAKRSRT